MGLPPSLPRRSLEMWALEKISKPSLVLWPERPQLPFPRQTTGSGPFLWGLPGPGTSELLYFLLVHQLGESSTLRLRRKLRWALEHPFFLDLFAHVVKWQLSCSAVLCCPGLMPAQEGRWTRIPQEEGWGLVLHGKQHYSWSLNPCRQSCVPAWQVAWPWQHEGF